MIKEQFQKELLENVTEGVKPSDLKKKLKRSKSADDIVNNNPPTPLLQDQLKVKQSEIELLRKQKEELNSKLTETTQQLDNSLFARVEAVKQFGLIYTKLQLVKQELNENVEQASDELINQDEKISQYRTNQRKATARIQELEKDLNLAQRLAELRKYPLPNNSPELDYFKLALFSGVVIFTLWLLNSQPTQ